MTLKNQEIENWLKMQWRGHLKTQRVNFDRYGRTIDKNVQIKSVHSSYAFEIWKSHNVKKLIFFDTLYITCSLRFSPMLRGTVQRRDATRRECRRLLTMHTLVSVGIKALHCPVVQFYTSFEQGGCSPKQLVERYHN